MKKIDMAGAVKLGYGEPCWDSTGMTLSLFVHRKGVGFVLMPIRPRGGFNGRDQEYDIYAVPRRAQGSKGRKS